MTDDKRVGAVDERPNSSVSIALQEYNALRTEVYSRSSAQHTLINLNITAIGLILGIVLANPTTQAILLTIPIVSSSFGLLYFDHAGAIERIGVFVRFVLKPSLDSLSGGTESLRWDEFAAKAFRLRRLPVIAFAAPVFVIFIGSPVAASIAVVPALDRAWQWPIWAIGVLAELVLLTIWFTFFAGRSIRNHQNDAEAFG